MLDGIYIECMLDIDQRILQEFYVTKSKIVYFFITWKVTSNLEKV